MAPFLKGNGSGLYTTEGTITGSDLGDHGLADCGPRLQLGVDLVFVLRFVEGIHNAFECLAIGFGKTMPHRDLHFAVNVVDQITFDIDGSQEKCAVPMGYAPTAVWYNTDMWNCPWPPGPPKGRR